MKWQKKRAIEIQNSAVSFIDDTLTHDQIPSFPSFFVSFTLIFVFLFGNFCPFLFLCFNCIRIFGFAQNKFLLFQVSNFLSLCRWFCNEIVFKESRYVFCFVFVLCCSFVEEDGGLLYSRLRKKDLFFFFILKVSLCLLSWFSWGLWKNKLNIFFFTTNN